MVPLIRFVLAGWAGLLLTACATVPNAPAPQTASGLVSAADPRAAEAGAAMLRRGGSATDAAIATMLALTVVEPQSSGIGGGGFFVRGTPDGDVTTLDGRETAPAAAGSDWFFGPDGKPLGYRDAVLTGLSVGVPGNVALAAEAHERFGVLPWTALFEPAIALAEDGAAITPRFREFLGRFRERGAASTVGRRLFYDAAGEPLPVGTMVRNPALARTFRQIAASGPTAFYAGERATALAETVAEATPRDAAMTPADLAAYRAVERPPVCGFYRGYRVCGMGPPSSGATTVLGILGALERFDLAAMGPRSPAFWHLFVEAQRLAYADRELYLADSDFVRVPVGGLVDPAYLAERSRLISIDRRLTEALPGTPAGATRTLADGTEGPGGGTSHIVATGPDGTAVSYTSTIEGPFGAGLVFGGFYLNNELTDFSFVPETDGRIVANRVEGGKRPRSSMAPTVAYDSQGRLAIAVGAAGGGTIPVQTAKALIGMIDFGLTPDEALALPLAYGPGDRVAIEEGSWLEALADDLRALGHEVAPRDLPLKANAAMLTDAGWIGAADPRSEGAVAPR